MNLQGGNENVGLAREGGQLGSLKFMKPTAVSLELFNFHKSMTDSFFKKGFVIGFLIDIWKIQDKIICLR